MLVLIQLVGRADSAYGGRLCTYIQFDEISDYEIFVCAEKLPLYLNAR